MVWIQILKVVLLIRVAIADADAPCYFPNGSHASGYFACDPSAYITSCCPSGWTCYSNSMCVVTDPGTANSTRLVGSSIRGTCTNPQWNNAICGDFCLSDRDISGGLTRCGDDKYCCTDNPSCSCEAGAFHLSPGVVQTIIGVMGLEHTQTSSFVKSTSSLPSSGAPISTSTPTASSTDVDVTAQFAHSGQLSKPGQKAGLAVGVVAAVIFLAVSAWVVNKWCILKYRIRNAQQQAEPTSVPAGPLPSQDPYDPENAASFIPPIQQMARRSEDISDFGNAPFANAYERNTQSRAGHTYPSGMIEIGLPNGVHDATERCGGKPLSFVRGEGDEMYVQASSKRA